MTSESPKTLINGASCNSLAVSDRGLSYGHGVFETIRVSQARPVLWEQHMARMLQSCARIGIKVAKDLSHLLSNDVRSLCGSNSDGVIKIIITAGTGGRGYSTPEITDTQRIVTLFPMPDYPTGNTEHGVKVITCDYRLSHNSRLAGIKHLNRLDQVMARSEWQDPEIAEGIVLDCENNVVEGTMSNLFAIKDGVLLTPSLERAGVKGIMRDFVVETALSMGLETREVSLGLDELKKADELFVTNSVIGLWPIRQWDKQRYCKGVTTAELQRCVERLFDEKVSDHS